MAFSTDNLQTMVGRVTDARPNLARPVYETAVNDAIRACLDRQPVWADLLKTAVVSFPSAYTTGTISLNPGSKVVTGVSTAWPVSDLVNTTLAEDTEAPGMVELVPASMTGITADSLLLIDQGTPSEEVLAVVELQTDRFKAQALYVHPAGAVITQSSLAGRQLKVTNAPVFSIEAVKSATSLLLDMAWGAAAQSGIAYAIEWRYFTIDPYYKGMLCGTDHATGNPLILHVSQKLLGYFDPRRHLVSNPAGIADFRPSRNGNMLFELVGVSTTIRQIWVMYAAYWPKMIHPEDRPPWFINPVVFTSLATAACLRMPTREKDPFFNPRLARDYEQTAEALFQSVLVDNEAKVLQALSRQLPNIPLGQDPRIYDPAVMEWDFS